jgi:molecular chaperone DnaJ
MSARRDYYELLGVDRAADDATIKKAFRQLARELHPDVSDDPEAEARFREVAEAYEVLSKPETRDLYDRYGHDGLSRGGFQPSGFDFANIGDLLGAFFGEDLLGGGAGARRRRRGRDVAMEVEVDLLDAASGVSRNIDYRVSAPCEECAGTGADPGEQLKTCPDCRGAGRVEAVSRTVFGQFVTAQVCGRCSGAGKLVTKLCEHCRGEGRIAEERRLEVRVPAGIHDGQRIRISGQGHVGEPGASPGDVYVHVRVRPDVRFLRDGDDIVSTLDVTMVEAALGVVRAVASLDGELELVLEPGTQPGETRIIRGKGMPVLNGRGRGDHRVLVNVLVPRRLTPEQRQLLEEVSSRLGADAYERDEGFFDRVKAAFR